MAHKPQLTDLERRMAEMDRRLSETMSQGAAPIAQSALENQITAMAERLARAESQLTSLDTIERAVNQLYDAMEQTRATSEKTAEEAARRGRRRILWRRPAPWRGHGGHGRRTGNSGLAGRLARGARSRRQRRPAHQETLQAVHDTLEQIVSKLAELENNALAQPAVGTMAAAPAMAETAPPAMPAAAEIFAEPPIFDANPFTRKRSKRPPRPIPLPVCRQALPKRLPARSMTSSPPPAAWPRPPTPTRASSRA